MRYSLLERFKIEHIFGQQKVVDQKYFHDLEPYSLIYKFKKNGNEKR